jgi:Protein of unknown function (DUF3305)
MDHHAGRSRLPESTERMASLPVGVIVEWRALDNPWQDHQWIPVEVVPGAGAVPEWLEIGRGDGWVRYLIGTAPLELHRAETEAYKVNLSNDPPQVHILLRSDEEDDAPHEIKLFLVTASPYEAQDYLDTEDNMLLSVAMPDDVIAWVQAFIDKHHVDEPFYKRKRERYDPNDVGFGRKPLPDGDGGKGGSGRG